MGERDVPKTIVCSAMGIRGLSLQPWGLQELLGGIRLPQNPSLLLGERLSYELRRNLSEWAFWLSPWNGSYLKYEPQSPKKM